MCYLVKQDTNVESLHPKKGVKHKTASLSNEMTND